MRKTYDILGVFVLALLLGLLLVAGPASAVTSSGTAHGYVLALVSPGDSAEPNPDGSYAYTDYIAIGMFVRATGAETNLLLGYGVARLDGVIGNTGNPNHFGNNSHDGDFVILSADPRSFWDATKSYWENLNAHADAWLWKGTWSDGMTHNDRNHQATLSLEGCNALAGYHADLAWQSMVIDPNPTDYGPFKITQINCVVTISH
jgi:hypothetical protein